ncbi:hypothetical protein SAMN05216276_108611 [Streptosporangium subroseum]|uniref:Uncharacterized protein n=1 Tax=Streptosporangium subroseum TaxID=106412 RepID=A0A239P5E9_9ACTN|nr:hypothetical protein [Streptosporangium subroseum]SNT61894.1 hypothetical protein SAMN05216276_108611 [Streptosporangium subroseum]
MAGVVGVVLGLGVLDAEAALVVVVVAGIFQAAHGMHRAGHGLSG